MTKNSLLFYNLYPRNTWKEVSYSLLQYVPHDDIIVHITVPFYLVWKLPLIKKYLQKHTKIAQFGWSLNRKNAGETLGFSYLRNSVDLSRYSILSYIHSKGTSRKRKNTQPIRDWTELMRYFVVERLDICKKAFENGKLIYGALLSESMHPKPKDREDFPDTKFIFDGNFVSINIDILRKEFYEKPLKINYYGVERFWGTLCEKSDVYSPLQTTTNHYDEVFGPQNYKFQIDI